MVSADDPDEGQSRQEKPARVRGADDPFDRDRPHGIDRRTFVKGAAAGAALGAAAAGGMGIFRQMAQVDPYIVRTVRYLGVQQSVDSPAPRGLPLVPVRVDEEGFVAGVPEDDEAHYLDWYRYCSHESAPGLLEGTTEDDVFRYFLPKEKVERAGPDLDEIYWYHARLDEKVRADDFRDRPYGSGAAVRWRSEGVDPNDVVTALVLKLDPAAIGLDEERLSRFMDMEHHLIGVSTFCTHLCCVPGYKEDPVAKRLGSWDWIYCGCHGSRFDPTDVREFRFDLRIPRDAA